MSRHAKKEAASLDPDAQKWSGPTRRYDLVKEFVVACVIVGVLTVILAVIFGSPDEKAISLRQWSTAAPADFIATAATELDGTSVSASYGAPYNTNGEGQKLGPLALQKWAGVREPIDSAQDFVINPLRSVVGNPQLTQALATWDAASPQQRQDWASAYDQAIAATPNMDPSTVKPGDYGPVPVMLSALAHVAQTGSLDGALTRSGGFYVTDYTAPLLFLADSSYMADKAQAEHLTGDQWGMMNETGNFPGQAWLWLYTFWYQISPFNHSGNADALVWGVMALLTLIFICVPLIPGLRRLPRHLGVYRLIWRQWYADPRSSVPPGADRGPSDRPEALEDVAAGGATQGSPTETAPA